MDVAYLSSRPNQNSWVHFLLLSLDEFLSEGFGRLISHHSSLARFKGRTSGQAPWEVLRGHYGLLKNGIIKRERQQSYKWTHMCFAGFPGWFRGQPYEQWSSFEKVLSILFSSCTPLPYSWEAWASQEIVSCLWLHFHHEASGRWRKEYTKAFWYMHGTCCPGCIEKADLGSPDMHLPFASRVLCRQNYLKRPSYHHSGFYIHTPSLLQALPVRKAVWFTISLINLFSTYIPGTVHACSSKWSFIQK